MKSAAFCGAAMQARPNHEDPSPRPDLVSTRPQVEAASSALPLPLPHSQPTTGKENGRAMVFRGQRTCRVLLRSGVDHAPGARRSDESCDVLPWRSSHGPAERLSLRRVQIYCLDGATHPECYRRSAIEPAAESLYTTCVRRASPIIGSRSTFRRGPVAQADRASDF